MAFVLRGIECLTWSLPQGVENLDCLLLVTEFPFHQGSLALHRPVACSGMTAAGGHPEHTLLSCSLPMSASSLSRWFGSRGLEALYMISFPPRAGQATFGSRTWASSIYRQRHSRLWGLWGRAVQGQVRACEGLCVQVARLFGPAPPWGTCSCGLGRNGCDIKHTPNRRVPERLLRRDRSEIHNRFCGAGKPMQVR